MIELAPPREDPLPRWLVPAALGAWVLMLLVPATQILRDTPIYGDDHSSHLAVVRHLIALLRAGSSDFFCPTFNLGFPMYLYYQPLPHLTAAGLHLLSFGLLSPQLAFNATVVLLWLAYPLTTFVGLRWAGLDRLQALIAALCAPLVSSCFEFGFTLRSLMGLGLYTQHYAMVLFPLAFGACWRALGPAAPAGLRACITAAAWTTLLSLCHAFYGVALSSAAMVVVIVRGRPLLRGLGRLLTIGAITGCSLLFWLVPLARTHAFAGGWPFGGDDRRLGYGALAVGKALLGGQLLDRGHLPTISIGLAIGVVALVALQHRRRRASHAARDGRAWLGCWLVFLVFLVGRRSLGHIVDIQPANLGLQLFRYVAPVQALSLPLAGIGLAFLGRWLALRLGRAAAASALVALLAAPAVATTISARGYFSTIDAYDVDAATLARAGAAIDADARARGVGGRVYAHNKVDTGAHLVAAAASAFTAQPLGQSYGVGMHDSLGFYFLEYLDPRSAELLRLYGFRYALVAPDNKLGAALPHRRALLEQPRLHLLRLDPPPRSDDRALLTLGRRCYDALGAPRQLRPLMRRWLDSPLPAARCFVVALAPDAGSSERPTLRVADGDRVERRQRRSWRAAERPFGDPPATAPRSTPVGRVERFTTTPPGEGPAYSARVALTARGLVVLKVNYHPFWRAEIDGAPAPTSMASPSFLAVEAAAGRHEVRFFFRNPTYQKLLLLAAAILWALIGAAWAIRRRANRRT